VISVARGWTPVLDGGLAAAAPQAVVGLVAPSTRLCGRPACNQSAPLRRPG
jgi:hypothetical protein